MLNEVLFETCVTMKFVDDDDDDDRLAIVATVLHVGHLTTQQMPVWLVRLVAHFCQTYTADYLAVRSIGIR